MDVMATIAVGSLIANFVVASAGVLAVRNERAKRHTDERKAEALEQLARSQTKIVQSLEREINKLREELHTVQAQGSGNMILAQVRAAELEEKRRQAEWRKTRDIFRGLGWLMEREG